MTLVSNVKVKFSQNVSPSEKKIIIIIIIIIIILMLQILKFSLMSCNADSPCLQAVRHYYFKHV